MLGGFVTAQAARDHYGVVITDEALDTAATQALRADRPATKAFHRITYREELL